MVGGRKGFDMNKFLQIKEWKRKGQRYFYAERLGVDSVAFVLHDRNKGKFGLVREFKPPIDDFLITAFGGSLDKDVPMGQIVKEEVKEEAGYDVIPADISYAGRAFVSTQMNQWCYLYLVDVTNTKQGEREPETYLEADASVEWLYPEQIKSGDDWKAITILTKMGF